MFGDILDRLRNNGWDEACPTEHCWRFYKGRWSCWLNWSYGTVTFARIPKR